MTGLFLLDWAVLAVSLFNTMLMVWLALTVWLNAARRTPGVWITSLSLCVGGAFFVSHTVIAGQTLSPRPGIDFWWQAGLWAVAVLPLAWYGITLWHAGFWNETPSPERARLRRRHTPLFVSAAIALAGLGVLLQTANPLPTFSQVVALDLAPTPRILGWPLLIVLYPAYSLVCLIAALDALLRPGPAARLNGGAARRRARPWLAAASALLLAVSVAVAGVMGWLVQNLERNGAEFLSRRLLFGIGAVDLLVSGMLAGVMVLIGQAIVTYEVFTGQVLPRQGLQRYWRRAVLLAGGFGLVIGWAMAWGLEPIFVITLTALVTTGFYALLSWRAYSERERAMRQLRPFIASEHRYETLLESDSPLPDAQAMLATLSRDVLGARRAQVLALGPLAPLVSAPLTYPASGARPADVAALAAEFTSPATVCRPLDPAQHDGWRWAVPLWSERGLIGVLLLGERASDTASEDGGLYSQEEVEIARAGGERLVDAQASAELTRRLLALQRERLAESQVVDQRVRRSLHDDILPRLHAALLELSAAAPLSGGLSTLAHVHRDLAELLRTMPAAAPPEVARLGVFGALRHLLEAELPNTFDSVSWQIAPEAEHAVQRLPAFAAETVFYAAREAVRNAARHGRGASAARALRLHLGAALAGDALAFTITDDGVGLDGAAAGGSGTRQGLALHSALLAALGGTLAVANGPQSGVRVTITAPLPRA